MIQIHKVETADDTTTVCNIPNIPADQKSAGWEKVNCSTCLHAKPLIPWVPENKAFCGDNDD